MYRKAIKDMLEEIDSAYCYRLGYTDLVYFDGDKLKNVSLKEFFEMIDACI